MKIKRIFPWLTVLVFVVLLVLSSVATAQTYNWTPWNYDSGSPPSGSFLAGSEPLPNGGTRQLYICRSRYTRYGVSDGVHPGKVVARYCNIGFEGEERRQANYDVLTNVDPDEARWVGASDGYVPVGL